MNCILISIFSYIYNNFFIILTWCLNSISINAKLYCMQIIRPQNLRHLNGSEDMYNQSVEEFEQLSASKNDTMMDLVVCINEIKMGVLAKGVMYPGANTLLMNLVSSFSDEVWCLIYIEIII